MLWCYCSSDQIEAILNIIRMPPAQTDDLIRLTRAAAFSCCGCFYTTGCWKTGILLSIRAACLLSDPVSLPLSESSGAFLTKKDFCRRTCFHASAVFYTQGYALPFQAFWANVPFDVMFFTNGAKILSGGIFSTYINFKRRGNLFSWKSCPTT